MEYYTKYSTIKNTHTCPYKRLFQAVILQALSDVVSKKKTEDLYRRDAINWFTRNYKDFSAVCQYAGIEPAIVRKTARRIMAGELVTPMMKRSDKYLATLEKKAANRAAKI